MLMSSMIWLRSSSLQALHLLAAESQQLPGEVGGAAGSFLDLIHIAAQGMLGRQRIQHQLGVGTDDHQQIVEVMRHASGQSPDRIHLLRLLQLIFQPPPVGDVPIVGDKMRDPAFTVAQGSDGFLGDENVSVLFAVHHGAAKHIARENGLPHLACRVQNSAGRISALAGSGPSILRESSRSDRLEGRVHVLNHALAIGNHDQVGRLLDRAP